MDSAFYPLIQTVARSNTTENTTFILCQKTYKTTQRSLNWKCSSTTLLASHFKGYWDGIGGSVSSVIRKYQRIRQQENKATGSLSRIRNAKDACDAYKEHLENLSLAERKKHKCDEIRPRFIDKDTVKRMDDTKEILKGLVGTKKHKSFAALKSKFVVKRARYGCRECRNPD